MPSTTHDAPHRGTTHEDTDPVLTHSGVGPGTTYDNARLGMAHNGAYPSTAHNGAYPGMAHNGGYPSSAHNGAYPGMAHNGGYPSTAHNGARPGVANDAGRPDRTDGDYPEVLDLRGLVEHAMTRHGTAHVDTAVPGGYRHATYATIGRRAARLAHALHELGVREGDRVATFMWNNQEHLESYLAIPSMGAVVHPIDVRLQEDQIVEFANQAEDRVVIVDGTLLPSLAQLLPAMKTVEHVVINGLGDRSTLAGGSMAAHDYGDLIDAAWPNTYPWPDVDQQQPAAMCHTADTIGDPSLVVYSHRSICLHAHSMCLPGRFDLSTGDCVLAAVPQFQALAWCLPYAAALAGASLAMPDRFLAPAQLATFIATARPNKAVGVPSLWQALLDHSDTHPEADISSLQAAIISRSGCPASPQEQHEHQYVVTLPHTRRQAEQTAVEQPTHVTAAEYGYHPAGAAAPASVAAPTLSRTPTHSGAPALTGVPALARTPAMTGSPTPARTHGLDHRESPYPHGGPMSVHATPAEADPARHRPSTDDALDTLLDPMVAGEKRSDAAAHAAQAWDLPVSGRYAVVVQRPAEATPPLHPADLPASVAGLQVIWRRRGAGAVGVCALGTTGPATLAAAFPRRPGRRTGVSLAVNGMAELIHGWRQAELAARTLTSESGVACLEERLSTALLAVRPDLARELSARVLAPVLALDRVTRDLLLDTLAAWFAANGSALRAASALYCHRNTVLNRLRRLERLTKRSLAVPKDLVELSLALEAYRLRITPAER